MWIKGLDTLLLKLSRNYDLTRIKSIGGAAQHALVWWKSTTVPSLSSLDPHLALQTHFPSPSFSLPNTPIAQDTSSHTHALAIEALLGGPDHMAARVGTCASASLVAAQLLRVRESWPQEVWARTGRIQLASAFIASLLSGKWVPMGEAEACATGLWVHGGGGTGAQGQGGWDEHVLDIVGGSREEGRRVRGWLGEVDVTGGGRKVGNISRYLVERFGFDPDTIVTSFTSDYLATYLSICPSPSDAVLSFGPMDTLMTPAQHYLPTRLYNLYPHPAQEPGERRRYIAVLNSRNADVPRALVRDMYTKSWSAFDRLVAIVPPGGSIGLDDKLFSFWHLQGDPYPFSHVKGIYRFETGIKVNEFRDLRANPRCLLESQVLSFRVKWSKMIATGVLGANRKLNNNNNNNTAPGSTSATPPPLPQAGASSALPPQPTLLRTSTGTIPLLQPPAPNQSASLGLPFDPYDHTPLPIRIFTTGAAANFPSVANLVGDIFNAPVYVPATQVDSAQVVPHRNAPAQGYPSRASLGAAYVARWVWGKDLGGVPGTPSSASSASGRGSPGWVTTPTTTSAPGGPTSAAAGAGGGKGLGAYEDEIRRLFGRRWVMSGGVWARTNVNGVLPPNAGMNLISGQPQTQVGAPVSTAALGGVAGSGAPGSGLTSTGGIPGMTGIGPIGVGIGMGIGIGMGVGGMMASGSSSPYGSIRGGLGNSVLLEEEENEVAEMERNQAAGGLSLNLNNPTSPGVIGGGAGGGMYSPSIAASMSTMSGLTASTSGTSVGTGVTTATNMTTPDLANGVSGSGGSGNGGTTAPTPLTPVVALQTGDSEAQLGLAKVAEPDLDSFLAYAAIVPEYHRLEGMLIKSIV
ncbi:hypothetical protein K435DRAFT_65004 [Dendrothele bispora CBS 962.96]|uniref:Actin-like ATPase domain-containing protein n=1 Tax=Dendrothele bispora (strain CBS 962.96) TaxID=1314807 RepID=A0A4S8KR23_DENBC|nr:hypothetical protein K435DRAFT_65004 [Dendrothele bispora CBS 962.96]